MSSAEFHKGMHVIGAEILKAAGQSIDLEWDHGLINPAALPPESVALLASKPGTSVRARFSREQLEDSAERIDRPDVLAIVRDVVVRLI